MAKAVCFANACKSKSGWFYGLPVGVRNEERRNEWLHRMGRNISDFHFADNAYYEGTRASNRMKVKLCEKHFSDDQFENKRTSAIGMRKLKSNAVPDTLLEPGFNEAVFDPSSYVEVQMKPQEDDIETKTKSRSSAGARILKIKPATSAIKPCLSSENPGSPSQKIIFFPVRDRNITSSQSCNVVIRSEVNIPQTSKSSPKVKKVMVSQVSRSSPSKHDSLQTSYCTLSHGKPATVTKLNQLSFGMNMPSQSRSPNIPSLTIAKPKVPLILKKVSLNDEVIIEEKMAPLKNQNIDNISLLKRSAPVTDSDISAKKHRLLAPKPYTPVSSLCRLCAENEAHMIEIFSKKGQQLCLAQKMAICFPSIQLDQSGRLPLKVCTACLPKLEICFDIIHSCNDANKRLVKLLQTEEQQGLSRNPIPLILIENNNADFTNDILTDDPKRMCVIREKFVHVDKNLPAPEQIAQVIETVKAGLGAEHNLSISSLYNTLASQSLQQPDTTAASFNSPFKCAACQENLPDWFTLIQHQLLKFRCRLCQTRFCSHKSRLVHHRSIHKDRSVYNCNKCKMTFSKKELLNNHKVKNHFVKCNCCSKAFISKLALIGHLKQEMNKNLYKCKKCKTKFSSRKEHIQHVQSNTCSALQFFLCPLCGKEFYSSWRLQKHQETHMPDYESRKKFVCEFCNKRFIYRNKLSVHMMFHTGEKAMQCKLCSKGFVTSAQLNYHMEVHANERKYECDTCKSRFLHKVHLVKHIRNKHLHGIHYQCEICFEKFALKDDVMKHCDQHAPVDKYKILNLFTPITPFKCGICGKCLVYRDSYNRHIKRHEDKERGATWMCEICGKSFTSQKGLNVHSNEHTNIKNKKEESELIEKTKAGPTTVKRYECQECHKKFSTTVQVLAHMASHTGVKPFKCSFCETTFTTKANKNLHELKHKGIKNFVCEHCNKPFYNQYGLVQHMRSHTREKPYKCNFCEKAFPRRPNLTAHLRTHTGERPYICEICNHGFTQKTSRDKHMTLHTKEKLYKCEMCDFATNRKKELNDHSLAQHRMVFDERNLVKLLPFQDNSAEEIQEAQYQIQIIEQQEQEYQ